MRNKAYLIALDRAYELIENRGLELIIDEISHKRRITVEVYNGVLHECVFDIEFKRKRDFIDWVSNGCNFK